MKRYPILPIAIIATLWLCSPGRAEDKPAPGPLSPDEMAQATEYVIPPAADIFGRLGKVSKAQWQKVAAQIAKEDLQGGTGKSASKAAKAISLGVRVADAFIAVQAEDEQLLRKLADVIEKLGADLNVSAPIQTRGKEARRLVEEKKWVQAGTMLANMRGEVINELQKGNDKDSVVLASLGGWLRGLDVVSATLAEQYDAEATKVLRDPALIKYLKLQVEGLSAEAKAQPFVKGFLEKADEIQRLVNFPTDGTMKKEDLVTLSQTSSQLVKSAKM